MPPLVDVGMRLQEIKTNLFTLPSRNTTPYTPPFEIDPDDVLPLWVKSFRVTFSPPDACDTFKAVMVANGSWSFQRMTAVLLPLGGQICLVQIC